MKPKFHRELHRSDRIGWLRAAVLGANDGILSIASIVVGVASADTDHRSVLLAGVAGAAAGAMSMAAGEYVSVSSQADTEDADRIREITELRDDPDGELVELTQIYISRGLDKSLAKEVARQLTAHDKLTTHLRDELGIMEQLAARPLQAAFASAIAFAAGAALPLLIVAVSPLKWVAVLVAVTTISSLAGLGALSASAGGAPMFRAAVRVAFWGVIAMAATSLIGWLFGVSVA